MEYAPYGDLKRYIDKGVRMAAPFPEEIVWRIFMQVRLDDHSDNDNADDEDGGVQISAALEIVVCCFFVVAGLAACAHVPASQQQQPVRLARRLLSGAADCPFLPPLMRHPKPGNTRLTRPRTW